METPSVSSGLCEVNHQPFGFVQKYRYTADSKAYLAMANGYPFDQMIPPYKYRTLTPTLTAAIYEAIPGTPEAMEALTLLFLWAFYTMTAWTLLSIGVGAGPILLGFAGTLAFWHVYLYQNPWSPDALFFFTAALLIFAAVKRRYGLYLGTVVIGMLNKESLLFLTPLWLATGQKKKAVLAMLAGVGVYLLPRIQDSVAVSGWYFQNYVPPVLYHITHHPFTFVLTIAWAWGLVWYIGARGALKHPTILWAWGLMLAGALIACIGGADHGRMMASMSPAMMPAIALYFERG